MRRLILIALCGILLTVLTVQTQDGEGEIKRVFGLVDQSVVLQTGRSGLADDPAILWGFGPEQDVLASFNGELQNQTIDRFRGRIRLDPLSGSLTITHLSLNDTGVYYAHIINKASSHHRFNLTIFDKSVPPTTSAQPTAQPTVSVQPLSSTNGANRMTRTWRTAIVLGLAAIVLAVAAMVVCIGLANRKRKI